MELELRINGSASEIRSLLEIIENSDKKPNTKSLIITNTKSEIDERISEIAQRVQNRKPKQG